jgi:hypothetical protein
LQEIQDSDNSLKIINKINYIFENFQKKSFLSYEKATILVGKEIAQIKESCNKFLKYKNKFLQENRDIIDFSKTLEEIEKIIKEIENLKNSFIEVEKQISETDNLISDNKKKIEKLNGKISEIKESEEYSKEQKERRRAEQLKDEIKAEIYSLREIIDLKELANIFHINQNDMVVIKSYKDNFYKAFQESQGVDIMRLINNIRLDNKQEIIKKYDYITNKYKELKEKSPTLVQENKINEIQEIIKKLKQKVENFEIEKIKYQKRKEKINQEKDGKINLLKHNLNDINEDFVS